MDDDEYVELRDGTGRLIARRTAAQYRAALLGSPCPEYIELDQGANRCPFMGESLNNYWCSRPAEHDGPHIATEGDAPGAEVLAIRAE